MACCGFLSRVPPQVEEAGGQRESGEVAHAAGVVVDERGNVNDASEEALAQVCSKVIAARIVEERDGGGGRGLFADGDDLRTRVQGVGDTKVLQLREAGFAVGSDGPLTPAAADADAADSQDSANGEGDQPPPEAPSTPVAAEKTCMDEDASASASAQPQGTRTPTTGGKRGGNVNRIGEARLQTSGLSSKLAEEVVHERNTRAGPFTDWENLRSRVPELTDGDQRMLEAAGVTVGDAPGSRQKKSKVRRKREHHETTGAVVVDGAEGEQDLPLLSLNDASEDDMCDLAGISRELARAVLAERSGSQEDNDNSDDEDDGQDASGDFVSWSDVERRVPGMDAGAVDRLRGVFTLDPSTEEGKEAEAGAEAEVEARSDDMHAQDLRKVRALPSRDAIWSHRNDMDVYQDKKRSAIRGNIERDHVVERQVVQRAFDTLPVALRTRHCHRVVGEAIATLPNLNNTTKMINQKKKGGFMSAVHALQGNEWKVPNFNVNTYVREHHYHPLLESGVWDRIVRETVASYEALRTGVTEAAEGDGSSSVVRSAELCMDHLHELLASIQLMDDNNA